MCNRLDKEIASILNETIKENANIRHSPSGKMLQIASTSSRDYYLRNMIPEAFTMAHINGDIHIHDLDYYSKTPNCIHVPLYKLLSQGYNTGNGYIRPPKRFSSAVAQVAIILQSVQNDQHGGVSINNFDIELAPFVEIERQRIAKDLVSTADVLGIKPDLNDAAFKQLVEEKLRYNVYQAMEALVFNLNTMHSRAGAQVPFTSINVGLGTSPDERLITEMLLRAYNAGLGKGETPIFPQIIFKRKAGINKKPGDPNYDLYRLALEVAAYHINPTFLNMDASFNKDYGIEPASMGCRTRVVANVNGPSVTTARGNLSFTTINLPRLTIKHMHETSPETRIRKFFEDLDQMITLCINQLYQRYRVQCRLKGKDLPFLIGQNIWLNSEQIGPDDYVEPAFKHGTLSVGFIGLAETLVALIGKHHGESEEAQQLGLKIVSHMRKRMDEATKEYNLNFTLLATPAEGLSGRFVELDRERFGVIPGVTDKDYYTNSSHVPVSFPISMSEKARIEGPYHALCNAGHIFYIEQPGSWRDNIDAIEKFINFCDACDIGYMGINFPKDICNNCAMHGTFTDEACPYCGSTDILRIRKVTGYLGYLRDFNPGKRAEEADRTPHGI